MFSTIVGRHVVKKCWNKSKFEELDEQNQTIQDKERSLQELQEQNKELQDKLQELAEMNKTQADKLDSIFESEKLLAEKDAFLKKHVRKDKLPDKIEI